MREYASSSLIAWGDSAGLPPLMRGAHENHHVVGTERISSRCFLMSRLNSFMFHVSGAPAVQSHSDGLLPACTCPAAPPAGIFIKRRFRYVDHYQNKKCSCRKHLHMSEICLVIHAIFERHSIRLQSPACQPCEVLFRLAAHSLPASHLSHTLSSHILQSPVAPSIALPMK